MEYLQALLKFDAPALHASERSLEMPHSDIRDAVGCRPTRVCVKLQDGDDRREISNHERRGPWLERSVLAREMLVSR